MCPLGFLTGSVLLAHPHPITPHPSSGAQGVQQGSAGARRSAPVGAGAAHSADRAPHHQRWGGWASGCNMFHSCCAAVCHCGCNGCCCALAACCHAPAHPPPTQMVDAHVPPPCHRFWLLRGRWPRVSGHGVCGRSLCGPIHRLLAAPQSTRLRVRQQHHRGARDGGCLPSTGTAAGRSLLPARSRHGAPGMQAAHMLRQ